MDKDQEEFIKRMRAALERAREETDRLPISVPSPLRDQFFSHLMDELSEDTTHRTAHCEGCRGYALNMALSALGWQNQMAPRPETPKERMEALCEQVEIALRFLEKLHHDGLN